MSYLSAILAAFVILSCPPGTFIRPARTPVISIMFAGILGALYFQELHAKIVAGGPYLLV